MGMTMGGDQGQGEAEQEAAGELQLFCFPRLREFLKERRPRRGKGLGKITHSGCC